MNNAFYARMQSAVKRVCLLMLCAILCLGLIQAPVWAVSSSNRSIQGNDVPEKTMSDTELAQKRAERREAQSQASKIANTEDQVDSIEEVFSEKLNMEEIFEGGSTEQTPTAKSSGRESSR